MTRNSDPSPPSNPRQTRLTQAPRLQKHLTMVAFLGHLFDKFSEHRTLRMASSLAFYTSISLAPLLIIFVSWSSQLDLDFQQQLLHEITVLIGAQGAEIVAIVMKSAHERSDLSTFASLVSSIIMLVTSSFVFGELRTSLNEIFEVKSQAAEETSFTKDIICFLRDKIVHMGLVLSFFGLLVSSLVASSFVASAIELPNKNFTYLFNIVVSLVAYAATFCLVFRYIPSRRTPWRAAFSGALGTAVLFLIGKELIAIYLSNNGISSAYGAAGSLVVFSTWIYYSATIILLGAEIISLKLKGYNFFSASVPGQDHDVRELQRPFRGQPDPSES